jgi:zinc/manganese transport system permease protein
MMLPAAAARFWTSRVFTMAALAVVIGIASCLAGLLLSYHAALPSGPAVVLTAGAIYLISALLGTRGALLARVGHPHRHRTA